MAEEINKEIFDINERTKITVIPSHSTGGAKDIILLEGELTIDNIAEITNKLSDSINKYIKPEIKIRNLESMDLTCIQLLHSIKKTVDKLNKKVDFDMEFPGDIKALFLNSGFDENLNIDKQK